MTPSAAEPIGPIEFFDRYDGRVKTEAVFGDQFLRWAYETGVGRLTVESLVKRAFFSRLYGWWMQRGWTRGLVADFIKRFEVDVEEFADDPNSFESFNAFFIRKLKPEARPIDGSENALVFPADGRHLGFANLDEVDEIFAKGQRFSLPELLRDGDLAERFAGGAAVISRLCPVDYHRFHFPFAGQVGSPRVINGVLYSVNPVALRRSIGILCENRRVVTPLRTREMGEMLIVEIGATNVGSIVQTFEPDTEVARGSEKGYFQFGGSMTILLFEPNRVRLADDLLEQSACGRELYARMGDRLGILN